MTSPDLFSHTHARTRDPDTSHQAAKVAGKLQVTHRDRILLALNGGPMQFEEIAQACGLKPAQVWKRLSDLEQDGEIDRLEETRPTSSGCEAHLYRRHQGEPVKRRGSHKTRSRDALLRENQQLRARVAELEQEVHRWRWSAQSGDAISD